MWDGGWHHVAGTFDGTGLRLVGRWSSGRRALGRADAYRLRELDDDHRDRPLLRDLRPPVHRGYRLRPAVIGRILGGRGAGGDRAGAPARSDHGPAARRCTGHAPECRPARRGPRSVAPGAPKRTCQLRLSRTRIAASRRTTVRVRVILRGRSLRGVRVLAHRRAKAKPIARARTGARGRPAHDPDAPGRPAADNRRDHATLHAEIHPRRAQALSAAAAWRRRASPPALRSDRPAAGQGARKDPRCLRAGTRLAPRVTLASNNSERFEPHRRAPARDEDQAPAGARSALAPLLQSVAAQLRWRHCPFHSEGAPFDSRTRPRFASAASIGTHIPCSAPNRRGFESAARFACGSDARIRQEYRVAA